MSSLSPCPSECLLMHAGLATIATGLPSIRQYLRNAGVAAEILCIPPTAIHSLADEIARHKNLRLIGISMHWHPQAPVSIKIAELLRALPERRHVSIVFGGMTASYFAEDLIRMPFADFVVKGDGELPMLLLFRSLTGSGTPLSSVPNLYYKQGGEVIRSREIYCIDDETLASLERQVIEGGEWFARTRSVLSVGRGCDYACIACGGNRHGLPRWGNRNAAMRRQRGSIKASIKTLLSRDVRRLFLLHDYDGQFETLGECLGDFDLSSLDALAVDAWGLPRIENLKRAFSGTKPGGDLVVTLELSPESGCEETRARVRSCSYSNADLTAFLDHVFSHYKMIRIVLCFSYFLPGSDKHNRATRSFIHLLTSTYLRQIIENRLQIQFWPLSTDPGSSIQQDLVAGLDHDVRTLADYMGKMLAMKSTSGNFLRHWPAGMGAPETDKLRHFFTYENVLRLLYPVLYLNMVRLFDDFHAYDEFIMGCFEQFYDVYLRGASASGMHAQHVALETASMFGFSFSGDDVLPKLSLVLVWLGFVESTLRKLAASPPPGHCCSRVAACFCPDLISLLSVGDAEFGRFSGEEIVKLEWTDMHSYVLELVGLTKSRETFRLGQASQKRPSYHEILLYNGLKIDAIVDRGLFECGLMPARNILCETAQVRFAHVSIPPITDTQNIRFLGAGLFEKLIREADLQRVSESTREQLSAWLSADGNLRRTLDHGVEELWSKIFQDGNDELARLLADVIVSCHVPCSGILAHLGIPHEGGFTASGTASAFCTRAVRWRELCGALTDRCDIRIEWFYLNHLKSICGCRDVFRPGGDAVALLTSIYYPAPGSGEGAFVFYERLDRLDQRALDLCDGTRAMRDILGALNEMFPDFTIGESCLRDMMITWYSKQIIV